MLPWLSLSSDSAVFHGFPAYRNDTGPAFWVSLSCLSSACPRCCQFTCLPPHPHRPRRTPPYDIKVCSTGSLPSPLQPAASQQPLTCGVNQPWTHILLLPFSVPRPLPRTPPNTSHPAHFLLPDTPGSYSVCLRTLPELPPSAIFSKTSLKYDQQPACSANKRFTINTLKFGKDLAWVTGRLSLEMWVRVGIGGCHGGQ